MKAFLGEDFLLSTDTALRLYHDYAKPLGIIDFHCHLPPQEIAENRQFDNMTQIWLEGDHYKWRGMRAAGIEEKYITGAATEREKYNAWAKTVPLCLGNPLYIWTHLELQRPFNINNELFGPETADKIWDETQGLLATSAYSAQGIIQQMDVQMIGTTDDPIDDLQYHQALRNSNFDVKVLPSWRPDRVYKIDLADFSRYIKSLGESADIDIQNFSDLLTALTKRLDYFAEQGCSIADHGIEIVRFAEVPNESTLTTILQKGLQKNEVTELEIAQYFTALQVFLGQEYAKRGWVMQYHMGAQRDNNSRMLKALGPNTGFDSIGDRPIAEPLANLLNAMDESDQLPKTILYGINPGDNEVLGTMLGNFQGGGVAGKIQLGSAWWFNDQKDGMERQLMQLSQLGLLSQFVGMLTDSRSFLSYTRHEYFRRILCAMLGNWVENGELPNEPALIGGMVEDICFNNANRYFNLNL